MVNDEIAIYVHWPFCESKCPYCDFNSHVRDGIDHEKFLRCYLMEFDSYKDTIADKRIKSIFFGGGTPSLALPKMFSEIIDYISKLAIVDSMTEITIEANPSSSEAVKFIDFAAAGVNRLSIGVQSLDDRALKFLGRKHSSAQAKDAIECAEKVFQSYSIDMIYALPWHTQKLWHKELNEILQYTQHHISLYQLTIEKGTPFFKDYANRQFKLPNDDLSVNLYEITDLVLTDHGYYRYEISNHAHPHFECKHNMAYWCYQDYIGVGPGAHSRISVDGVKYANVNFHSPEKWLSSLSEGVSCKQTQHILTEDEQHKERILMGLRMAKGIPMHYIESDISDFDGKLYELIEAGLLQINDDYVSTTKQGTILLNKIVEELCK